MTPAEIRTRSIEQFRIEYPGNLPVSARAAEIRELWQKNPVLIVCGETGSGKTTQLPKIALEAGCGRRGMIGCTQPRRIAAVAMARRLAQELNTRYGVEVGSQVRFENRSDAGTVLKFMTDGILLSELRNDPQLRKYDCIIIDEVHERTLNIDFLLGVLRELLTRRRDLKVAISSATLDAEKISEFFSGAPVVTVAGRTFPVEDIFLEPFADEELPEHVARAVTELDGFDKRGDILVFLPGEREIRECAAMLNGKSYNNTEILPLYSRLGSADQQRVFHPGTMRRIILSTNVAETSLTIPRIKFCIDSGLARVSRYNPRSRIQELQIEMISRSSARQRRGRCGRTADGICVHLYSEEDFERADEYTDPEIKRTSLAGVILQMAALKLPDIRTFSFLDPPSGALIREGFRTLTDIRAMDGSSRVTRDGRRLASLPLDPHLGRMLLTAESLKVLPETVVLCAGLSIAEVRERPAEKPQPADQAHAVWKDERSDFTAMLNLWNDAQSSGAFTTNGMLRKFCKKNFLNFTRMREWKNLAADLAEYFKCAAPGEANTALYNQIHEAVLSGIPRNIAKLDSETRLYRGCDGKKFTIFPGSGLAKRKKLPEYLFCFALMETSRVFGRVAAEVDPALVLRAAPHLCVRSYDQEHFESSSGFVRAREKVSLGSLLLHAGRQVDFSARNPVAAREIFIREGLCTGSVRRGGSAVDRFNSRITRLLEYETRMRKAGFLYDESVAAEYFLRRLPAGAFSAHALKELTAHDAQLLDFSPADVALDEVKFRESDYPDKMVFAGMKFPLHYTFEPGDEQDGVTLYVPESELNLLPDCALSYPVPGYYALFAEAMLRALPKEVRRQIGGIALFAEIFADQLKRDPALKEVPPAEVLSDMLARELDIDVNPRAFDGAQIPEYLQMKLGILNASGKLKSVVRELPERFKRASKLSAALPGSERLRFGSWTVWDPAVGTLPDKVELPPGSGRFFYPALTVEPAGTTVGCQLYIKHPEAERHHAAAVATLFLLGNAQLVKMVRRTLRLSNELRLSMVLGADAADFERQLLLAGVAAAAENMELWQIRSHLEFETFCAAVRENFSAAVDELVADLERFTGEISEIRALARRAGEAGSAITGQLKWLFAPGFLKRPALRSDYRRYLRALKLRASRAADAPGRDLQKSETLALWEERFAASLAAVAEITDSEGLYEFWMLLEECRISVFAPEVKTAVKSPLAKLAAAWEKLRI